MQQHGDGQILCSPSDLVIFLECRHASFLDVKNLSEKMETTEASSLGQLLQEKGMEHEAAYLRRLKDEGKSVVEIPGRGSLKDRSALTLDAMRSGVDVIYQAVFFDALWRGDADFLIRCGTPSALGDFSYEALDTKLSRTAKPTHIMQLCVYSWLLAGLQDLPPVNMHLLLGDGGKYSFRVADFFHYHTRTRKRFEAYVRNPPADSRPEPCSYCDFCRWRENCTARWEADDHLSRVANIRRSQMETLRKAGIKTVAGLAATSPDTNIPDMNRDGFVRLQAQAALQHHKAVTGEDKYEILPSTPGKGLARIPPPDSGDLFFDIEGDPLYPKGLEYLLGVHYRGDDGETFKPFWAHDHREEKESFKRFMAFLSEHLARRPHAYIYHYNHYETSALKRLACRHAVCEEQLDNLLRDRKFIDLYLVVRESIRTSEPGYSIKDLETFYMGKRADAVATATDSIIVYNEWRETGADALLRDIADYNEVDCVSIRLLRDWLLTLRPEAAPCFEDQPEDAGDMKRERKRWEIQYEEYQIRLGVTGENPSPAHERLSHLLEFHNREAKPQWWEMFDRQSKTEQELIDDIECIGGMWQTDSPEPEEDLLVYEYQFPPQEYKLRDGAEAYDTDTMKRVGTIEGIDENTCIVKIRPSRHWLSSRLSLGPHPPIDTRIIRSAIYRYADHVLITPHQRHVATEILAKNLPRIRGKRRGEAVITSGDLQGEALEAVAEMDNSYLFIQGPPGTGKTYSSAHIIVDLIRRGRKIGVTSNSHKAIHTLLDMIESVAAEKQVHFRGVKKATSNNRESFYEGESFKNETSTKDMNLSANLFAGTVWTFANDHFIDALDYLFIDEAGQVVTANVVAMAASARNIVLVGDQMQLGQPVQGTHPGEAGLSVLEFLLGEHATVPAERGILLDKTYRMRPSICRFVSEAFYDGRLRAHESTMKRSLSLQGPALPDEGIVMIPAEHEGCSQKSVAEGEIIEAQYQALLGQPFTIRKGKTRPITGEDILVISPYNVQVNYLRSLLPDDARVGTIDKFQGQEAAIVLISMVTSSAEDLPRRIEFLYSRNRLNVAISRAQCLAIVTANPRLLEIPCKTVEQIKLVNTFCWLDEYAVRVSKVNGYNMSPTEKQ